MTQQSHIKYLWETLTPLGYPMWWLPVRNYNPANYAGNKQNIFLDSGVINLVISHKSKAKLEFLDTALIL